AVPSNVIVHYNVPPEELRKLYRRARVVVIPLYQDDHDYGFEMPGAYFSGMTVLGDCAALGKAVVMTATASAKELLKHEYTAELVAPEDPIVLADAIRRVCSDEQYRKLLSQNMFKLYDNFSIAKTVNDFIRIIGSTVRDESR
ncbi:glycosyltransferase family 4 protein, partial [Candidatus Parcubacteria bacterium]|nr:glycosyltransferase family 4 protein [Candidatus Parcubacteria bacterium]